MRSVRKPWIAFTVLGAGRMAPREGFDLAFQSGADFVKRSTRKRTARMIRELRSLGYRVEAVNPSRYRCDLARRGDFRPWTKEEERHVVVFHIEFEQGGRNFEADITSDGAILNWEQEISARDLPAAVRKTVDARYPNAILKQVMAVTAVKHGREAPEGYEVVLETAGGKAVEVSVTPAGKVAEEAAEKQ